ncbi:MAG: molecular chaperone TorD family protein [Acidobacteriota bacterium]|nr:molecular chaperone TorD family protein [Acidobacteriota bacterium]
MESTSEIVSLIANRENLYRLLSRFYRIEIDEAFLCQLEGMTFPEDCNDADLAEGYKMLTEWLLSPNEDPLTNLAVDYARVFLGAGIFEGPVAYPYESVYTSKERLIMQEARDQVLAIYRAKGLERIATFEVPEDHVSIELEFMSHLCREAREALLAGDPARAVVSFKEQREFLDNHPLKWIPAFCADIEACATSDFYLAVAKMTRGFLNMEQSIIEELVEETMAAL